MNDADAASRGSRRRFSPRSAPARRKILQAARARFAQDGYDRTTIRNVAADAGVDPAMVMRYYGSKAELFTATIQVTSDLVDLSTVPRDEVGTRFARLMLGRWERGENEPEAAVLRAAPTHPDAVHGIQATFDEQIAPALKAAFPDDPDINTRAGLVLSQGFGVILCRYLLKLEPIASMEFDALVESTGASFQRHLTGPLHGA